MLSLALRGLFSLWNRVAVLWADWHAVEFHAKPEIWTIQFISRHEARIQRSFRCFKCFKIDVNNFCLERDSNPSAESPLSVSLFSCSSFVQCLCANRRLKWSDSIIKQNCTLETPSEFPLHLSGRRDNSHQASLFRVTELYDSVAALQCLSNQGASLQITVNALGNLHQPSVHCKDWECKHGNNNLLFWWIVACCAGAAECTKSEGC